MTEAKKHALVAGGLGVIGRNLVEHLSGLPNWDVTAISDVRPISRRRRASAPSI
jgi:nucleoside-diphosphate-sugar epimerase